MSGYQVITPRTFEIKDPQDLIQFNLNTLNSTFSFPDQPTRFININDPVVYSASQLLGN